MSSGILKRKHIKGGIIIRQIHLRETRTAVTEKGGRIIIFGFTNRYYRLSSVPVHFPYAAGSSPDISCRSPDADYRYGPFLAGS